MPYAAPSGYSKGSGFAQSDGATVIDTSGIQQTFGYYTEFVALAILVAGFVLARVLAALTGSALNLIDQRTARYTTSTASVLSPALIRLSRTVVFWLVFLVAVVVSLWALGVGGVSALLNTILAFTPQVLVGFAIVVAGYLAGLIARHGMTRLVDGLTADAIAPRLLQGTIVAIALVLGLQQVGVDISFITRLVLILVATISAGLMLAFALGARQHVANLLARRELERLAMGQRIRVGDIEGEIVDIYSTGVDIATADGVASVPAARFAESGLLHIDGEPGSG